jgi:hypothetical protein
MNASRSTGKEAQCSSRSADADQTLAARWNLEASACVVMASLSLLFQLHVLVEILRHVEVML